MTCPRCGIGTLAPAVVAETLRVGANAVEVSVAANLCGYCGEHWFDPPAQAVIDAAIKQVRDGDVSHLAHLGELYRVP
jgi:YgiT-type zinc finger domain-containing protein